MVKVLLLGSGKGGGRDVVFALVAEKKGIVR